MFLKQIFTVLISVVVGVCIILRLPQNGWGSVVWYVGLVCCLIVRTTHFMQYDAEKIVDKRITNVDRIVATCAVISPSLLPALHFSSGIFAFADYALPSWTIVLGTLLLIVGFWLTWRSHIELGVNWCPNVEVREEHTLVTTGVYSSIRHPMYACFIVYSVSQPFLVQNWLAGAIAPLTLIALFALRAPEEDRMMQDLFGNEFEQYKLRTGRIIPKFGYSSA